MQLWQLEAHAAQAPSWPPCAHPPPPLGLPPRARRLARLAAIIDQDSDFFEFLMRLFLRGILVEIVFKKLMDDA